jgi:hypothetical protein
VKIRRGIDQGIYVGTESRILLRNIDFPRAGFEVYAPSYRVTTTTGNKNENWVCEAEPHSRTQPLTISRGRWQSFALGQVVVRVEELEADTVDLSIRYPPNVVVESHEKHWMSTLDQAGFFPVDSTVFWLSGQDMTLCRGTIAAWNDYGALFGWAPTVHSITRFGKPPWRQRVFPDRYWHPLPKGVNCPQPPALAICESEHGAIQSAPYRPQPNSRRDTDRRRREGKRRPTR